MGLEMVAARALLRSRGVAGAANSGRRTALPLLALMQGRAPYKCTALSRPMDRSKITWPRCSTGKSGRERARVFLPGLACLLVSYDR